MAESENIAKVTPYYGKEKPIAPTNGRADRTIRVELSPEGDDSDSYWPPPTEWHDYGTYTPTDRNAVVLNVETTGLTPWDSRISDIALKIPGDPSLPVLHFIDADEETLMKEFLETWEKYRFNEIIGYNVSFDIRFLFAVALRYRLKWPLLIDVEIYDLMNTMEQVFSKYVYGNNKPGTLNEWGFYLFGEKPPMTQAEELKAWADGDYEAVKAFNEWKVNISYNLASLIEYVIT